MARHPLVLIVDYDPKNLRALSDLLRSKGYAVESASDGVAALAAFKSHQPAIVLLEAMIPKKHGFEVCQEIKKTADGKSTPVIIMTGVYKGRKYRSQAMHVHGCDEYVEKPCPPETILEMVTRFVPPPPAAALQAVSGGRPQRSDNDDERRGEVIPFPTARAGRSAAELDDEAEREIMSRLDEILPDTPMVGSRDAEEQVPFSASAAAPAVTSTQVTDEPSFGGESDDAIEIDLESDPIEESAAAPAAAPIERSEPEATKGPAAKTEAQTPKGPTRASRDASKGAPREPARPQALEIVPPPKRKSSISPFLLISLCIAVLALVVYWISTSR